MFYIFSAIFALLMVGLDQLTKHLVVTNMAYNETHTVINGLLNFTYVPNTGGAFGFFADHRWLLISLSSIILVVCVGLLIKNSFKSRLVSFSLFLILAGGVGNMIDRIARGRVVDFISISFFGYVFNVADCCVVVGAVIILVYFIFDTLRDYKMRNAGKESEETK